MNDMFKDVETVKKKATKSIRSNIGYLSIAAITIVYLFIGFFSIDSTGKTIIQILISSAISLMVGISITKGWAKQGLIEGSLDPDNKAVKKEHAKKVSDATPYFKYADEWAAIENKAALKDARYNILMSQGLYYNDYFDENGRFSGAYKDLEEANTVQEEKAFKEQNKTIRQAVLFRVTPITVTSLTSGLATNLDRNYLGDTEEQFEKRKGKQDMASKIAMSIVFGMFGFEVVKDPSWASFMYSAVQATVFQVGGVIAYYSRFVFKTRDEIDTYNNKIAKLDQLMKFGQNKEVKLNGDNTTINAETKR